METAQKLDERRIRMTWPEIKAAYPDQWVVLGELNDDEVTLELHSAVVRGCGKTRRESWNSAQIGDEETETIAHLYTGLQRGPRRW